MKREEQIEVATATYINGRLKNNVPPEEIEEIRLAYQAGAIYADEHPDLYSATRKAVESETEILDTMSNTGGYCNSNCKIWHICQDRLEDTYCRDKKL